MSSAPEVSEYRKLELIEQYKNITGLHDDELVAAMLDSVDWDLPRAVDNHMGVDDVSHAPAATATYSRVQRNEGDSGSVSSSSLNNPGSSNSSQPVLENVAPNSHRGIPGGLHLGVANVIANGLDDDDDVEDDMYDDDDFDHDAFVVDDADLSHPGRDSNSLVPAEYSSIDEALQHFSATFESRYGSNGPDFSLLPLNSVLAQAFDTPGSDIAERRPLALYIHHGGSVACNIFAQHVLCDTNVSKILRKQYITWGWDVTYPTNKNRLYEWFQMMSLNDVFNAVRAIPRDSYPLLVLLVKERRTYNIGAIIRGDDGSDSVTQKLLTVIDSFAVIKQRATEEERARAEREQIRAEQHEEYERSKAADRAKQDEKLRIAKAEREAEEARLREEREAEEKRQKLSQILPTEPTADEPNIITIRLRFPSGDTKIRRFRKSEKLQWLVTYCDSIGYDRKHYRLFTSDVPKKDVASLDNSKSFADLKWPPREQITVDEL